MTVSIDDDVLRAARRRASDTGLKLSQLLDLALRRELALPGPADQRPSVPVFRGGTGARPGIDLTSNRALERALDEPLP